MQSQHPAATGANRPPSAPGSRVGIGIDFGTTNSVAAVFDGNQVQLIPLEPDSAIMPSATYIDRQLQICTGQEAIDQYIAANTGRTVELSAELLGEARGGTGQTNEVGQLEEAETQRVYGQSFVDAGETGRLFRGVKRLLGNAELQRLMVFDRPFRLVALITPLLVRIQAAIAARLPAGQTADHACIGRPVNFEGREAGHNDVAVERLAEACRYAGFDQQCFYPEPIAAAVSYLHDRPGVVGECLLAVDFGGGTLDLCVLRHEEQGFTVVATHGVGLGGDHIDQRVFRELLFPLLGKGERWRRRGEDREIETLFPFEEYEDLLLNWAVSYMLNQNRFTHPVTRRIQQDDAGSVKFRRLYEVIKRNYSYLIFQCIKDTKARLSEADSAVLDIPELDIELTVTRAEFEALIAEPLAQFREAVLETLRLAQVRADAVDLVLRTGGSCLIPAVRRILDELFPGKVIEHDPFTSVAAGLAIAEYQRLPDAG